MTTKRIIQDTEIALDELLIDSNILLGDPDKCKLEVGKRALDIYYKFEEKPRAIKFDDVKKLAESKGSQIRKPEGYLGHVSCTAVKLANLVKILGEKHPRLKLPHPENAFAMGLVHDLNATFSDYAKGGQQSKEFDEFLLAKRFGWQTMADQVALHSDYLGIIRLMTKGKEVTFPKQEGYKGMVSVLQGDGPLSYYTIAKEFKPFMEGEDNLNLILLTVADYTENGVPSFKVATFDKDFEARSKDIQWRYHGKAVEEGRTPSLLGQALVDGGMNRIERYKDLISTLLQNNPADVEQLRARTTFFYE